MDKYIDREAVLHALHEIGGCDAPPDTWANGFDKAIDEAYRSVQRLPAADVAPVVHGRWGMRYRSGTPAADGYVSTCCDMWNKRKSNYCPNCDGCRWREK